LIGVLAAGGIVLAACGDDDKAEAKPAAFEIVQTGRAAPTLNGPGSMEAGVIAVSFKNSAQAPADLQLIGVDGDHSVEEVLEVVGNSDPVPIPEWLSGQGGVGTIPPGQTATATMVLDAGKYYVVGSLDSGEEEEGPPPTVVPLELTGDGGGSLPDSDATVSAKEYTFDTKGLKAGANLLKFEDTGDELHHFIAAPIADGATIDDVKAYFTSDSPPDGPPPLDFDAGVGTAVIDKGGALVTTLDFKAGNYAFICFLNDRAGGSTHVEQGMIKEVNIPA
jgi:hypothetical protein